MRLSIPSNVTRAFYKVGTVLKKHSPEILMAAGVVGTVASTVVACKATTKVNDILEKAKNDIDTIHNVVEHPEMVSEEYTVEDSKKDLTIVYVRTGLELVKLYAPAVILGAASIGCMLASNNILHKRNAAIAAAYATVDGSFKRYRNNVVDRFGEELDRELKYNIKAKEIEETVVGEDGKETTVKKVVNVAEKTLDDYSQYARFFDETCTGWTRDAEYNLCFLKNQQAFANKVLKEKGILFLNEVYEMLGIQRTKAGQEIGWVWSKDSYVDFGIYDIHREKNRHFVNGYEKSILLDFNVDGVVYDHLT